MRLSAISAISPTPKRQRRFRQRSINGATSVHDNELYSDSFATNSFALGINNVFNVSSTRTKRTRHPV